MRSHVQRGLDSLRLQSGLYLASPSNTYHYVWIRDNCYATLSELDRDNGRYEQTYHAMLDIFRKYEWKLSYHAAHKPEEVYQYIHPRYTAESLEEIWSPWGNAQNDAVGLFLFGIGEGIRRGLPMLRDDGDDRVVSLLIDYLGTLEFWSNEDNGMWEETRELHASSVGACVAGLLAVQPYFDVDMAYIRNGLDVLFDLLPNESATHDFDLALLSLIYPYRLLSHRWAQDVIDRVESSLLRDRGVIRYHGDMYYADNRKEAEWCLGLPWLGLCHATLGDMEKARHYLNWTQQVMTPEGNIPELYLACQGTPNENTPLAWAHSLYLILDDTVNQQLSQDPRVEFDYATSVSSVGCAVDP